MMDSSMDNMDSLPHAGSRCFLLGSGGDADTHLVHQLLHDMTAAARDGVTLLIIAPAARRRHWGAAAARP